MRRAISILIGVGLVLCGAIALMSARPAFCVWCPTYKCFARCSSDCACISAPGEIGGSCYGVQWVDDLPEGWSVIEEAR